jgi:integrase
MKGGITKDKKRRNSWMVWFPGIRKRFNGLEEAEEFLTYLRYKDYHGGVDPREFQMGKPMGFSSKADAWLEIKKEEIIDHRNYVNHMKAAKRFFGQTYIKDIGYEDIQQYVMDLPKRLSKKTKANYLTTLRSFWQWLIDCREVPINQVGKFPVIKFKLAWRNTVTKHDQQGIIAEVKRITYHYNPRIWIGIKWLSTYISIRPNELRHIKEGDFDFELGTVTITHNKEVGKYKVVPMLEEDLEIVKSMGPALPHMYFFRHGIRKGVRLKDRGQFGKDYLYSKWIEACKNLGVSGVDMYGGTKHSSVKALRNTHRPDEIKQGTMHSSNTAFERYYQVELEDARKIYRQTGGNDMVTAVTPPKRAQVIDFPK